MLELKEVSKKYGFLKAVDNVSFTVRPGESVGYLGPNGAGKFIIGDDDEDTLVQEVKKAENLLRREINYVLFRRAEYKARKKNGDLFIKETLKDPKVFLVGGVDEL
jgi:ABC-type uncharacterized transport system ATPase subunit